MSARRPTWRFLGWASVLALLALLALGACTMLDPRPLLSRSKTVLVHTRGGLDSTAILVRHADRWAGSSRDFPSGSVAHVQPRRGPGFFLVRDAGGTFRAYLDRSPHRGEPIEYRDPLPGTDNHGGGPQPGFYDPDVGASFTLDGEPFQGPAPRPLDPLPTVVDGDRLEIGRRAVCPGDVVRPDRWCGAPGEGPRALPPGQAVVLLPPGGWVRVLSEPGLQAGAQPVRRLMENELRASGFEVVYSAADLERTAAAGARVMWVQHDALDLVDPAWARAMYAQCRAIGVLDGTIADLTDRFGLGDNGPSWIQPGGTRPVFALVRTFPCPVTGTLGQTSEWLNVSWLLTATRSVLDQSWT